MKNLQSLSINLLNSIDQTISSLTDRQYTESMQVLSDATIGQHVRHMLEFYEAIEKAHKSGEINYDARKRSLEMETSVKKASEIINKCKEDIVKYTEDIQIEMSGNYSIDNVEASKISSSLSRELAYSMDHTIHHLAIIKNALILQGVQLDENFGVAPSTIRYREELCAQ